MNNYFEDNIGISLDKVVLEGRLVLPKRAAPIVIFSHGSGSSRFSPRNQAVAERLQLTGIGTLLFDLLTPLEDQEYENRFDIELLTVRLVHVTKWLERFAPATDCSLGYFGASTGAASALKAAARLPQISAVISRGGRPDLAMEALDKVKAPTLLIVGGLDIEVLRLNEQAYDWLECPKKLAIVEGATHLFEEEGAMDEVMDLAVGWFTKYLQKKAIV
ncbi:alpha/beta hydrolase [Chitinophaga oryziterrae]|uniref:Alpha/beta hydrolase n=2 Tax=Chitinophaga oryziterrae TaxID=1031224 RepID=A0A6N8J2R4_9BACT|nr:alpha/beta hydrolase [Chitinophaga oryziterrae]